MVLVRQKISAKGYRASEIEVKVRRDGAKGTYSQKIPVTYYGI
jgi:hypothetical protein